MGLFDFLKDKKQDLDEVHKREQEDQKKVERITNRGITDQYGGQNFVLKVEDSFQITGRGTVVTGNVLSGEARVGETAEVITETTSLTSRISGIESFRKTKEKAVEGENVGLCLRDVTKKQLQGQVTVVIRR